MNPTEAPPESYRRKTAVPCPVDPDAGHLMVDQGRSEPHRAHLFACACGKTVIGSTDETRARAAARDA